MEKVFYYDYYVNSIEVIESLSSWFKKVREGFWSWLKETNT